MNGLARFDWRKRFKFFGRQARFHYDTERIRNLARSGSHRDAVGGLWDEVGQLTFGFLRDHGLEPEMQVLDVGCGALRVGIHLIRYLEPQRCYGVDPIVELLDAGYEIELINVGLQHLLPRRHLATTSKFEFDRLSASRPFDVALAQPVFTHLPLVDLRLCLSKLADQTVPGSKFFATVFHSPDNHSWGRPLVHEPGGITSYSTRNPYHYRLSDLQRIVDSLPWSFDRLEQWDHPRGQEMVTFTRTRNS